MLQHFIVHYCSIHCLSQAHVFSKKTYFCLAPTYASWVISFEMGRKTRKMEWSEFPICTVYVKYWEKERYLVFWWKSNSLNKVVGSLSCFLRPSAGVAVVCSSYLQGANTPRPHSRSDHGWEGQTEVGWSSSSVLLDPIQTELEQMFSINHYAAENYKCDVFSLSGIGVCSACWWGPCKNSNRSPTSLQRRWGDPSSLSELANTHTSWTVNKPTVKWNLSFVS